MHLFRLLILLLTVASADASESLKADVIRHYAKLVSATYGDSLKSAEKLRATIHDLLAAPSEDTLAAARAAWIAARVPYLQSETFRFYEGPVDQIDSRINSWPVDEGYIESIIDHPELHSQLSAETIAALNEKDGEKSISTGYHAIEFLLWGQDNDREGPGSRSYEDFLPEHARRRDYLRIITNLLIRDLQALDADWQDNRPDNYRAWFLASAHHQSLRKILHGMGSLSAAELAGERLTVAYETKEQEDEHSCFSDTTQADVIHNATGIRNVYTGQYTRTDGRLIDGPGIETLLRATSPALADELKAQLDTSLKACRSIPDPFDQAFLGEDTAPGRIAIHRSIRALQKQAETIAKAAALIGTKEKSE
jgi:putative iron-regulated protein